MTKGCDVCGQTATGVARDVLVITTRMGPTRPRRSWFDRLFGRDEREEHLEVVHTERIPGETVAVCDEHSPRSEEGAA